MSSKLTETGASSGAEKKQSVVKRHQLHDKDTGSPEVQIGLFTERIQHLTAHLKSHVKDHHTRLGLLKLVGKRRRMLDYLKERDIESYRAIVIQLELRR
ncbi:MAG: 30S ribosomal protein S15 [candidate division Zixibacteria bacterium]|nr:30S ribosomal protein S15 [candidate division Zixibacteria bacterium]